MKKVLVLVLALAMVMTSLVMPTAMAEEEPIVLTMSVNWSNENEYDSTIFDEMAAAMGVVFDITLIESEAASDKMTTMLLSGNYPGILTNPDFSNSQLMQYGTEEEILIPLESYLTPELTPNLYARLEEGKEYGWWDMITQPDGHIYGIPSKDNGLGAGHGDVSYKMHINTEWLDAVGMEMPTTLDGFVEVLKAFKEKDPNGNGIADEVGLMGCTGTWSGDPWLNLLNCFGIFNESYYYVKDGAVQRIADAEYFRKGLSYINKMYEDGLIDPGSFTQDLDGFGTVGNAATPISGAVTCGHIGMFVDVNNYDRFTGWTAVLPLEGPDGYRGIPFSKLYTIGGSDFSVTDLCEYPEVAMQFADLVASEEWTLRHQVGIKGVDWDYADEGTTGMGGVPAEYKYLEYTVSASSAGAKTNKWGWTLRLLETQWKNKFQVVGDYYDAANYENYVYSETIKQWDYAADYDQIPSLVYADADVAADAATMATNVTSYVKSSIAEFITGVKDVDDDATWEKYLSDLEGYQYTKWLDLIQTTINDMGYGL